MNLARALRLSRSPCLALVGAGGKTTALLRLAAELAPAVVTTSTHLGTWQVTGAGRHRALAPGEPLPETGVLLEDGIALLTGPVEGDRCTAMTPAQLEALHGLCRAGGLPLLIEADGARGWPLKAPAAYEPVVPDYVDRVVVTAGLSGLGRPLAEGNVHRPEVFARLSGLRPGDPVTPQALARLLAHPQGGLKGIPPGAGRSALLNQADTPGLLSAGGQLAESLLEAYPLVVLGSLQFSDLRTVERTAGVILAAGEASRFGGLKQLEEWRGRPLVVHAVQAALAAGLSPVVVVSGAQAERVEAAVAGLPVTVARNEGWREGQASSLRLGLAAVPETAGAAVFLLADQPQVPSTLLRLLVAEHRRELSPILAPLAGGRRANPVLFDRDTFPDLRTLTGDVGGRALFSRYPPAYVPWQDEGLLLDVDTPGDLQRLRDGG